MTSAKQAEFLPAAPFLSSAPEKIAYHRLEGSRPCLIWCGGLKSDMNGSKALYVESWARERGRAFIRFDYYGHGQSSGRFRDGTISRWASDIVAVIDALTTGDVILIGSSMGGWASLLACRSRRERIAALALIAPAPDFTERLIWASWPEEKRAKLLKDGIIYEPSDYDEPYEYAATLFEDGRANLVLGEQIPFEGPVRILQGAQDSVVPWAYARDLADKITSDDVTFTLVKSGDHSLSRPQDLDLLGAALENITSASA